MADTTTTKRLQRTRAQSPLEISTRLHALARNLDRKLDKGEAIDAEQIRSLAKRLRSYAKRLRPASAPFSIY